MRRLRLTQDAPVIEIGGPRDGIDCVPGVARLPAYMRGVNLAGAEFALESQAGVPGTAGTHYFWPSNAIIDYHFSKGFSVARVPILWERCQRAMMGPLNEPDLAELDRIVKRVTGRGAAVVIDLHNYMRRWVDGVRTLVGTGTVTRAALNDFWSRMAARYKNNGRVIFGLMNEPNSDMGGALTDADNVAIQNEAAAAVRAAGATNLILFAANDYSGMHQTAPERADYRTAHLGFVDPGDNWAWDAHQYFDTNYDGSDPEPWPHTESEYWIPATFRIQQFIDFARPNGIRAFYGEFNTGTSAASEAMLRDVLDLVESAPDVFIGWCWWAGGGHWPDTEFYSLDPLNGADRPQLAWLRDYLPVVAAPAPAPTPTPAPAPTGGPAIAVTSGSGYAGSTYTVSDGGTGIWQVDAAETGSWSDIADASGTTFTPGVDREGLPLRWLRSDGQASNVIHMWMPNDLGPTYITAAGARWLDFKLTSSLTMAGSRISAMADRFGNGSFTQATDLRRPVLGTVGAYQAGIWNSTANDQQLDPAASWAPAYWMVVARYKDGTDVDFDGWDCLIGANASGMAVKGYNLTANLQASWASRVWVDGAETLAFLPGGPKMVEAQGTATSLGWAPGKQTDGSQRAWRGPILEAVALAAAPTGDALDRLAACLAHRNGTISALGANRPANPYLANGPRL